MAAARRLGIVSLLVLLGAGILLAALPRDLAALRVAGVGVLWWYGALVAPLAGAVVAVAVLLRTRA